MTDQPGTSSPVDPRIQTEPYQVRLEHFEGPMDLLLFLIKQEEINIYDIPIARITGQYVAYLERVDLADLDSAGEFLLMAATLMRIKARMLLPRVSDAEEQEEDPRQELVDRLLEYQKFKAAAVTLKGLAQDRVLFHKRGMRDTVSETEELPVLEPATLYDLMKAFSRVLERTRHHEALIVQQEEISVEEVRAGILERLERHPRFLFDDLFEEHSTRLDIIVTLVAILDLVRTREVEIGQTRRFGEIWIEKTSPS
ncbi:MAG: segregation/condensation protein A [Candidatus Eisenbacteria sp.]|nr:segregation/condensation protein A [Candidatus Eisenbacteria bacterium]